jgi:hypothetical protein
MIWILLGSRAAVTIPDLWLVIYTIYPVIYTIYLVPKNIGNTSRWIQAWCCLGYWPYWMREITFENNCLIVSSLEQKNTSLIPVPISLNKIVFSKNNLDDRYDAKKLWYLSSKFSYYLLLVSPIASTYYTWKLFHQNSSFQGVNWTDAKRCNKAFQEFT